MLDGLPYQVKRAIARKLDPFYIHTLGSSCSEWRAILRSNQRVLSNRRTLPGAGRSGNYSEFLHRFPNADTLRLYGEAFDLSSLGACELTSLHLDSNSVRGAVASTIAEMSSLVSLSIVRGSASAAQLARAIVGLTKLESLCLARNELGATGTTALAPSLAGLSRLRSLDLSRNMIACDGATALATTLRALTALTELNIDANAIGARGFAVLHSLGPPGLARLTGLTGLTGL
jgi:hypothetical protein